MHYYALILFSYLLGSILFAIVLAKLNHMPDPRTYGSMNAGSTNMMRSGNKKVAVMTFAGDLLKGVIAVVVAQYYLRNTTGGESIVVLCGIFVVLGHIYPLYFKFKGGKGVATTLGVFLALNLWLGILVMLSWAIIYKCFKISSLSAIIAIIAAPVYAYFLTGNSAIFGGVLIIAFFVLYKHKANIVRLLSGKESSFNKKTTND